MSKVVAVILGIIVILAILVILVPTIANKFFDQKVNKEINNLFASNTEPKSKAIQVSDLKTLPKNVQKWLKYCNVTGKEKINNVRLQQEAEMRLERDKPWMPVKAEQYFTTDNPGFIWKADIKVAPFFHIAGRDKYYKGKGHMLIKLMSLFTVADSKGKEMDQGTLLRFLAESVWFPTAALSDYIEWEEINSRSAKATMSYGGITASGVFKFNDKGEVINFSAERYKEEDGNYSLKIWTINMEKYKEFNGIKIPTQGEVTWELDEGDFTWFKFEIVDIDNNKPIIY